MEAILIFLAQAILSGAVGHYVSDGLKRIHPQLAKLCTDQADPKAIEQFVLENHLEEKVQEFAVTTAKSSYVIPNVTEWKAHLGTRATLFADILSLGFTVSNTRQLDLLLPGSFLGPHAFTLFMQNDKGVPKVTVSGSVVTVQRKDIYNNLLVFPIGEDDAQALWENYQAALLNFRSETQGQYFPADRVHRLESFTRYCEVEQVTAGGLIYRLRHALLMTSERRDALAMTNPVADQKAPVQNPYNGIHKMLDGVATVLAIDILDEGEETSINAIYDRLRVFSRETKSGESV